MRSVLHTVAIDAGRAEMNEPSHTRGPGGTGQRLGSPGVHGLEVGAAEDPYGSAVGRKLSRQCLPDEPRAAGEENHEAARSVRRFPTSRHPRPDTP